MNRRLTAQESSFEKFLLTFIVLSFCFCNSLFSQEKSYHVKLYGVEEGLVGNGIFKIFQDSKGVIWLGTNNGLINYDGFRFKRYRQLRNMNSIIGREIEDIEEDKYGNIWLAVMGGRGLQRLDPLTNKFYAYRYDSTNHYSISGNFVNRVHIDNEGNLWTADNSNGGINQVVYLRNDQGADSVYFKRYPIDINSKHGLSHGTIWAIDDFQNFLWIGTANGLNRLNKKNGLIDKFFYHEDDQTPIEGINCLYIDSEGMLWVGTDNGISTCDLKSGGNLNFNRMKNDPDDPWPLNMDFSKVISGDLSLFQDQTKIKEALHHDAIIVIDEIDADNILIGAKNVGVVIFNKTNRTFSYQLNNIVLEKYPLNKWQVNSFLVDNSGVVWAGGDGLYKFSEERFKNIYHDDRNPGSLGNNTVYSLAEDGDKLWIAHHEGIDRYDPKTGVFEHFQSVGGGACLIVDDNRKVWAGTALGLFWLNEEEIQFQSYHLPVYDFDSGSRPTSNLLNDTRGNLWITHWGCGVSKLNLKSGEANHYFLETAQCSKDGLTDNVVISIHESKDQKIWVGTFEGLYVYNKLDDNFDLITRVRDCGLITDGPGNEILFAGMDNLYSVNLDNYDEIEPFIHNDRIEELFHINNLVIDELGNFWIASQQAGLWSYNLKTNRAQQYSVDLGLSGYSSFFHSMVQTREGQILYASDNGIDFFHPSEIISGEPPQVSILDIELYSNIDTWSYNNLGEDAQISKSITLPYHVHTVNISFAVMDFLDQKYNNYEYKLENFNNEWSSSSGDDNQATFTNLDPGTYNFIVKGSNAYGVWNEEGDSLEIIVLPPPWKSWWAYTIYMITIAGLGFGIRKYEMKRMKLRQQYEEEQKEALRLAELDETKSNFFANISHEFRTPLTLILGYVDRLEQNNNGFDSKESLSIIKRNTTRVLHLVNQLLDLSKIEAGTLQLNIKRHPFNKVVKYIASQFTSLAEMKNIDFQVSCDTRIVLNVDPEKMEMIINNLISNAIKFTPENGKVTVELNKEKDVEKNGSENAVLIISDSGPGISDEEKQKIFDRFYQANISSTRKYEGAGIGLSISRELAQLHGGEIEVESSVGKGSTFKLILPMEKEELEGVVEVMEEYEGGGDTILNGHETQKHKDVIEGANEKEKPYILIVEDNEDLRRYLEENLSQNHSVKLAVNGKFGFDLAVETIPELIVSDLMMPDMDGNMLCEKIKSDQRTSHIPFILLTAKSDMHTKLDSFKTGADDYLLKPFNFKELKARIDNLINSRKQLEKKYKAQLLIKPGNIEAQSMEEKFLSKISEVLESHSSNPEFNVQWFAREIGVSEVQLFRKLKALTGQSANEIIRNYRLEKAAVLLKRGAGNIGDIAYKVGFNSVSYFTKCFREQYGNTPRELIENRN